MDEIKQNMSFSELTQYHGNSTWREAEVDRPLPDDGIALQTQIFGALTYFLIFLLGVTGNFSVMIVTAMNRSLHSSTNVLLLNLSVADLLVLLFCLPTGVADLFITPETWILGKTMCYLLPFLESFVANVSVLTVEVISLERYYAVVHPLRAVHRLSCKCILAAIAIIWILGAIFTMPMIFLTEFNPSQEFVDSTRHATCDTHIHSLIQKIYYYGILLLFYVIPVVSLCFLYKIITMHLLRIRNSGDKAQFKSRKKVIRMLGVVTFVFFFCHLPFKFLILSLPIMEALSLDYSPNVFFSLVLFSRIALYLNSAVNPLIYNVMSSKFRKGFKKIFGMSEISSSSSGVSGRQQSRPDLV